MVEEGIFLEVLELCLWNIFFWKEEGNTFLHKQEGSDRKMQRKREVKIVSEEGRVTEQNRTEPRTEQNRTNLR